MRTRSAGRTFVRTSVGTGRALVELVRSGVVGPIRPDRLARMAIVPARYRLTVAAGFGANAARHPDRAAIIDDDGTVTCGQLAERTDAIARALAASGVRAGTRVGVFARNHRGPVEMQVAAAKLGADVVLFNVGMSAAQAGAVITELGLHSVVADDEFATLVTDAGCTVFRSTDELVELDGPASLPWRPPAGHTIVLTSGTTGPPKGARRGAPHSLAPIAAVLSVIRMRAGEPVHIAAPLLHTWGHAALQLAMLLGSPIVLTARFDPQRFLDLVAEHRCDAVFAVPVMLQRVLELDGPGWRGRAPRIVATSGSALPTGLAERFQDRFGECLYNLYGSTEVSWVSIAAPADLRAAPGTSGRAPVGTVLAILDADGKPVPTGVEGRVFVANDMPFEGYTRAGADVERTGYLLGTGDIGRLDDAGRLHLTGRADDMIVTGGENVHPGPVENLLSARAEVREVAVAGVPDEQYGQRLAAWVVPEPGVELDADTVRGWVRAELSRFAVPRDVTFVDALPRNATGKVMHRELTGKRPVA